MRPKMRLRSAGMAILAAAAGCWLAAAAWAQNQGQADLDKALDAKLSAQSVADLGEVIRLCKDAIKAGLDESNTSLAKSLLVGTLVQRSEIVVGRVFEGGVPPAQWPQLRQIAVQDLEDALEIDPQQVDAHFLLARLNALPGGDVQRALKAVEEVLRLANNESLLKARALVLRAGIVDDAEKKKADYDEAVKLAPQNSEILRARGVFLLTRENLPEAQADFEAAIAVDEKNAELHELLGVTLFVRQQYDAALESFTKAAELAPRSPSPHVHRARALALQGNLKESLQALDKALELDPHPVGTLLLRARIFQQAGESGKALDDVNEVLRLRPGSVQALQLRAAIQAGKNKFDEAIADLEEARKTEPQSVELLLQLAMFHAAQKRPEKAIELYAQALAEDDQNWLAYRGRADAYLAVARQAEAIADYEAALKIQPADSGVLNNLAWVLATSPDDKLRSGKRAIELALEACKVTEYKQAHIISTLAAAYAETGDWGKATEWSQKAVELGTERLKPQLQKELESYQNQRPWRELQPPDDLPSEDDQEEGGQPSETPPPADQDEAPPTVEPEPADLEIQH